MQKSGAAFLASGFLTCMASAAFASVTISSDATTNMSCGDGVCAPTAREAVLNVGDLEALLAAGSVEVTTTGAGVQADDIVIDAPLTWSDAAALDLDAWRSITVTGQVAVTGSGVLSLATNDGGKSGDLVFDGGGDVTFESLASPLAINGNSYTLVDSVAALASAVAANPAGRYALANNYDASGDGTYAQSPVSRTFRGTFEGLGNSISNLTVKSSNAGLGLFRKIHHARLSNVALTNAIIADGARRSSSIGLLAGWSENSTIAYVSVGGVASGGASSAVGGLAGYGIASTITGSHSSAEIQSGMICGSLLGNIDNSRVTLSSATGNVSCGYRGAVGGLIGQIMAATSQVDQTFATGNVSAGASGSAGGLIGVNVGAIANSYASGEVSGRIDGGGLVGYNSGIVATSYSSGTVSTNAKYVGGLIGADIAPQGSITYSYWDTTSSGIKHLSQGAGNIANDPGITGLSTKQLRTGLPGGFGAKVWREKRSVNKDLPYLVANTPPK